MRFAQCLLFTDYCLLNIAPASLIVNRSSLNGRQAIHSPLTSHH